MEKSFICQLKKRKLLLIKEIIMTRNARRKNRMKGGYVPVTPKTQKKRNKKKDHKFTSTDKNPEIAKEGMSMELKAMQQRSNFYYVVIGLGLLLTVLDVKDKGLLFEGLGFKFSGTLVGILVVVIGVVAMMKNKPVVIITNE